MSKCENCLHKKDCIDGANFKNAENCERFKPYSAERIAEGRAIEWAVNSGACHKCEHLHRCANDNRFEFPQNAPCMVKKTEFLKASEGKENG